MFIGKDFVFLYFFFRNNSKNVSKNFKTALYQLRNSERKNLRKVASCILKILDSSIYTRRNRKTICFQNKNY